MNKRILIFTSASVSIILLCFLSFKIFIPSYISNVLTRETPPPYLPEKYKIQVERIQKPITKYSNEVFKATDSLNLSLNELLEIIDEIDPDEVLAVYHTLEGTQVRNSEDVYNLITEYISLRKIDIRMYKAIFVKHATPARINRLLRYAEEHDLATSLAPATAKKIAKQLAIKHYEQKKGRFSK